MSSFEVSRFAVVEKGSDFSDPSVISSEDKFDSFSAANLRASRFPGKIVVTIREKRLL